MADMTCLAEGLVVVADPKQTGLNLNEIILGPTGCGKTFSNVYSRLLHTNETSVVVPIAKKAVRDKFANWFAEQGYQVMNLDFSHPELSMIGYDPLDFVRSDEEIIQFARSLVEGNTSGEKKQNFDPYWNDSATSVLAAEIELVILNSRECGKRPCFADVIAIQQSVVFDNSGDLAVTSLDCLFDEAEKLYPGNRASSLWRTVQGLPPRTISCVFSTLNSTIDKICSPNILEMTRKEKRIDFRELGNKKVALFITTSPMVRTLQNLLNVLYADLFRELFESAESNPNSRLNVPVHVICDDFACGGKIPDFEDYISIFRAAGISVTLLLQSETQLINMYGNAAANTIINNCDTYVYMGGMDIDTCTNISKRLNRTIHSVMAMPCEQVVVFRRGSKPYTGRRYQILDDPLYKVLEGEVKEHNKRPGKEKN